MKTGWVVCANDKTKNERGYSVVFGERKLAKRKASKIEKKFEDRFKLSTNAPYQEVEIQDRVVLKCILPSDWNTDKLLTTLNDHIPFLHRHQPPVCFVEIERDGLEQAIKILTEKNINFNTLRV